MMTFHWREHALLSMLAFDVLRSKHPTSGIMKTMATCSEKTQRVAAIIINARDDVGAREEQATARSFLLLSGNEEELAAFGFRCAAARGSPCVGR